ncbi:MAG: type VI secretion system baseplate subunit TssF [Sulfuricurvum sp.]|uniref:type VI secretion system baseplate subunit TssF n=1 Tax=Sulfuricurvum sp. TaxID=2025608 RepID=UPI002610110A|nr:type VI secretion system baseplate subunit TssF [Sulfuricurvum sp.]MDD2839182.1 type VI secretion system baseplate subunit TssF [Sulfuricurvum sp.]MDD3597788.1 type VI secretion system baseplate subunit TssF [Sulfuricurvum sp.]
MTINNYYLQELGALRKLGEEFSLKNPGLSPYLSKEGQDPDVERVIEGFSFLTGRLRQQLDEELPEVSHNLAQLLWPNYVRPVPSHSVIAYEALRDQRAPEVVPKGTEVLSEAGKTAEQYRFRTCYDTVIHPIELSSCRYYVHGNKGQLELDFGMSCKGSLDLCLFESLRIYLNGPRFVSNELYLYLLEYVEKIEIEILDYKEEPLQTVFISHRCVSPVGFDVKERMVPYPQNIFDGYVILQEYFSFEPKYLFIDINGLDTIFNVEKDILEQSRQFRLRFHLSKRLVSAQIVGKENFVLYCTPIINLFEVDAIPIRKTSTEEEYLLSASEYERDASEVFLVEGVRGWIPSKNIYEDFLPFESFGYGDHDEYYSLRVKLSDDGERTNSYIRFASAEGMYEKNDYANATISVKLLCTNRSLPSQLQLGQINISNPHSNVAHLKFKNITIPTESYPPPIGKDFLWRVLSNMSLNYLSLTDIKTLTSILSTYDFPGAHDVKIKNKNTLMLKGLVSISHKKAEMIYEGFPIRGIDTTLEIDVTKFTGIGEAYLLCCVLNEFFALYCNINSFHRLEVRMIDHDTFKWQPKMGHQVLI